MNKKYYIFISQKVKLLCYLKCHLLILIADAFSVGEVNFFLVSKANFEKSSFRFGLYTAVKKNVK